MGAWAQSPQQAFGFPVSDMSLDENIIVHVTHVAGVCCLTDELLKPDANKRRAVGQDLLYLG